MSDQEHKFTGWGAFGTDSVEGKLQQFSYEPKKWDEEDVDSKSTALVLWKGRYAHALTPTLLLPRSRSQDPVQRCLCF